MLRFAEPTYLYLLLVIPVLLIIWLIHVRRTRTLINRAFDKRLQDSLMPNRSKIRPLLKYVLSLIVYALLVIVLARPQAGTKISNEKRNGIEAMVALDISNSMLAEDVAPSRLDKSKMLIENMIDGFKNDKVGLVVFAGSSFVQLPITTDFVSAKMFLQSLNPSLIASQGTDIGGAINTCINCFTKKENVGRAIVVITDGEDHEGGAIEAAKAAKKKGINVFVLGIGMPKGGLIPDGHGGYMKDNHGNEVLSVLNEDMCKQIAQAGGGAYIHVDNTNSAQDALDSELAKLQKGDMLNAVYSEYDEQFQTFAFLALVVLVIEMLILEAKNPLFKNVRLFKRKGE